MNPAASQVLRRRRAGCPFELWLFDAKFFFVSGFRGNAFARLFCLNLFSFRAVREQLQVIIYHRGGPVKKRGRLRWQYLIGCGWRAARRKRFRAWEKASLRSGRLSRKRREK